MHDFPCVGDAIPRAAPCRQLPVEPPDASGVRLQRGGACTKHQRRDCTNEAKPPTSETALQRAGNRRHVNLPTGALTLKWAVGLRTGLCWQQGRIKVSRGQAVHTRSSAMGPLISGKATAVSVRKCRGPQGHAPLVLLDPSPSPRPTVKEHTREPRPILPLCWRFHKIVCQGW